MFERIQVGNLQVKSFKLGQVQVWTLTSLKTSSFSFHILKLENLNFEGLQGGKVELWKPLTYAKKIWTPSSWENVTLNVIKKENFNFERYKVG